MVGDAGIVAANSPVLLGPEEAQSNIGGPLPQPFKVRARLYSE